MTRTRYKLWHIEQGKRRNSLGAETAVPGEVREVRTWGVLKVTRTKSPGRGGDAA